MSLKRGGDRWEMKEDLVLISMFRQGKTDHEIARLLERSVSSVEARRTRFELHRREIVAALSPVSEAEMVISEWLTLPDGVRVRTVGAAHPGHLSLPSA